MQAVSLGATRYDPKTVLFHWATAILVATQWLGAQTIDWFPSGALRVDARSVHIILGLVLAAFLMGRMAWRLTRGRRLPPADEGLLGLVAKAVHWSLYALLVAMVVLGIALAWTRGDSIFNLFNIPAYDPGNRALAKPIQEYHALVGWIILAVAGLHASAALAHHYVWHDGVLGRMRTGG